MSYSQPIINANNPNPIGLDAAILSIRSQLADLSWMSKAFGRAYDFTEQSAQTQRKRIVPKVYEDGGEYILALPNDSLFSDGVAGMCFIAVRDGEQYDDFQKYSISTKNAELQLIVWVDLKQIDDSKDYIFTEDLKKDVEVILRSNQYVQTISRWYDQNVEDVFDGYNLSESEISSAYMQYPFSGFRCIFTVSYPAAC